MDDVTQILTLIETGDLHAADKLLPIVYDELRRLAAKNLAAERPGQTLQPTALVHEACDQTPIVQTAVCDVAIHSTTQPATPPHPL